MPEHKEADSGAGFRSSIPAGFRRIMTYSAPSATLPVTSSGPADGNTAAPRPRTDGADQSLTFPPSAYADVSAGDPRNPEHMGTFRARAGNHP